MMKRLLRFALISLLLLTFFNGCKKDPDSPTPSNEPGSINLIMDESEAYQYTTIILEANQNVDAFDNKVSVGGVETSAGLIQNKYIAFTIQPQMTAGNKKLKLKVNGKDFEFPLLVKELPTITDPKATYSGYIDFMETLGKNTGSAIKEAYANANVAVDPQFASIETEIKVINDSLKAYEAKFNALPADEQMVAAKFMAAHKLKMQPVYDFMEDHADFVKDPIGFQKKDGVCRIDGNMSASWICLLNETRRNTRILMKECIINSVLGGATGALAGAIFGPTGLVAGAKIGLITFQFLNAKLILEYGQTLLANFGSVMVVTATEISAQKTSITYINGQPTGIKVNVKRRNLQRVDENSSVADLAAYARTTQAFIDYVKTNFSRYVKTVPDYKSERTKTTPAEKLEYVSVEVINNSKVKYEGMSGTPADMKLKFSTTEITDQAFDYKVKYDDGVYKMESSQSGVLKSDIKISLRDTTVGAKSSVINFKVEAPDNVSWTLSDDADWMFTTAISGKGTKNEQLSIQDHLDKDDRSGTVTLSVNGQVIKTIKITQTADASIVGTWDFSTPYGGRLVFKTGGSYALYDDLSGVPDSEGSYSLSTDKKTLTVTNFDGFDGTGQVTKLTKTELIFDLDGETYICQRVQ